MRKMRFRLAAALAGTTLCLFAMSAYAQNTNTPGTTTDPAATGSVSAPAPQGTDAGAATAAPQSPTTTTTGTDVTTGTSTTTTTTSFPGGVLGILAVAVLVLLVLFALFRGRDRTVVRETSTSASTAAPGARTTSTTTAADDRMNVSSRAASGTSTNPGGMNDPNARR
jgi:hypothetical protein